MQKTVTHVLQDKGGSVWSIAPTATVYEALQVMADKNVGALPVIDNDRLVGIVSERDYARKVILLDRGSRETPVAEIMSTTVHTVTENHTTSECMSLMTDLRIRHLPVMDGETIIGVISIGDVVRAVISEQQFLIDQLQQYITS